jgi:hypothetical protein
MTALQGTGKKPRFVQMCAYQIARRTLSYVYDVALSFVNFFLLAMHNGSEIEGFEMLNIP